VHAEETRGVYLQEPAARLEANRELKLCDDRIRTLGVAEKGHQAEGFDVLGEAFGEPETSGERHVDEDCREIPEPIAPHVLCQDLHGRGHLESKLEAQPERCDLVRHPELGILDPLLAVGIEPKVWPDMRRRVEHARAPARRLAAKREPFVDGTSSVVTGGNDVRMHVDEHPSTLAASRGAKLLGREKGG
jgi:hypothetical protein